MGSPKVRHDWTGVHVVHVWDRVILELCVFSEQFIVNLKMPKNEVLLKIVNW